MIFQVLTSCIKSRSKNTDKPVLLNYYRNDSVWKTDSIYLSKSVKDDTLRFIYTHDLDTLGYTFIKPVHSDSSIYLYGIKCSLISKKTFKINNKDFTILKYYYDEQNTVDEESSFFYHQDYGLLVVFNDGWLELARSMEYDEITKKIVDSIVNDRTGFYVRNFPPPPMLPDTMMIDSWQYLD